MISTLAALATVRFSSVCQSSGGELAKRATERLPTFDARVFQLPTLDECANSFLWRELDATKNSISMAAQSVFSHNELQGVSWAQKQEMLFQRAGINFNDYPAFFKRGSWFARRKNLRSLTLDELERIPEKYRPTGPVERTEVVEINKPCRCYFSW
jgi:tRNA(His) 5'-end guanylyltransferase